MKSTDVKNALQKRARPEKREIYERFFKTGKGEYGEGDLFIGLSVPEQRAVAKEYQELPRTEILRLLRSKIHEHRLTALVIMMRQFEKGDEQTKKIIYDDYLANTKHINNWDLIDLSAKRIIGQYLEKKPRNILYTLAKQGLWEKRIAILATFWFLSKGDFHDSLRLAEQYLTEEHDLMHKATGWMLREIGKKDLVTLEGFLKKHYKKMPRTMLRYAIERFPETRRQAYLKGTV